MNDKNITSYIDGDNSLGKACNELFKLGMTKTGKALRAPTNAYRIESTNLLSSGFTMTLVADAILITRLQGTHRVATEDLDCVTHVMLCALATGQFSLIEPFHRAVFAGLENGYGVRDGHNLPIGTTLRYAAFGLTIIGNWLGKPLDLDKHALPRDPAWGQLVAHWREPDPEKLLPVLLTACDTHVERIALTSRELDSGNFEFGSPFEAVYPAEILAILNLRRSLGLANPFIDHPLMKTPYAALTCPPGTRFEKDELLERFLLAARKHDPEAVPQGLLEVILQTEP
ncbi:hypothetical protein NJF44_22190 [Pseudomonas guariconensis]|uniref:hypothetical protein n=1 Tax=Pseudomonas TaxID=286 RepID=UPI00209862A9|nr:MULTISPECIES: hypothetical protein [Pseudomonas]MCO7517466.1 hypothetical protein [Pseudomonas putida]MCO7607950.1 hypothetical protein [Pseudomonas guariconensis]